MTPPQSKLSLLHAPRLSSQDAPRQINNQEHFLKHGTAPLYPARIPRQSAEASYLRFSWFVYKLFVHARFTRASLAIIPGPKPHRANLFVEDPGIPR